MGLLLQSLILYWSVCLLYEILYQWLPVPVFSSWFPQSMCSPLNKIRLIITKYSVKNRWHVLQVNMMNTNRWEWAVTRQAIEEEGTLEEGQLIEDINHFAGLHVLVGYRLCFKGFRRGSCAEGHFLVKWLTCPIWLILKERNSYVSFSLLVRLLLGSNLILFPAVKKSCVYFNKEKN